MAWGTITYFATHSLAGGALGKIGRLPLVHLDYERMTIEHLGSQSAAGKRAGPEQNVGMIGNLILVDQTTNNKLGNKDFSAKLNILANTSVFLDADVKKAKSWGDADVLNRTKQLAKQSFEKTWRF